MDPTVTLEEIRKAMRLGNWVQVFEYFTDLDEWLSKGGLWPDQWAED